MILARTRLGREVMRLVLAAVLVLSVVAGARMQGEMAALALALGPHGAALCSGAAGPPSGADQDGTGAADHCQTCVLPMLGLAAAPAPVGHARIEGIATLTDPSNAIRTAGYVHYAARGPPQAV